MKPTLNKVLFKPFPSDEISEGGIFVPDSFKEISNRGVISSVGNGTKERPMKLKAGMVVHRVKSWGQEVMIDDELHFLMEDKAILAIEQ